MLLHTFAENDYLELSYQFYSSIPCMIILCSIYGLSELGSKGISFFRLITPILIIYAITNLIDNIQGNNLLVFLIKASLYFLCFPLLCQIIVPVIRLIKLIRDESEQKKILVGKTDDKN